MQKKRKRQLQSALEAIGVKDASLDMTKGGHVRIIFEHNGRRIRYITGGTPSDCRSIERLRCDIRRMMRA